MALIILKKHLSLHSKTTSMLKYVFFLSVIVFFGACKDKAKVICNPSSASCLILGTIPQVDTVMFL